MPDSPKSHSSRAGMALAFGLLFLFAHPPSMIHSLARDLRSGRAATIVDKVDRTRLERVVRGLSGADSVSVNNQRALITTRYEFSKQIDTARSWLLEQVRSAGYEPVVQPFILRIAQPNLTCTAVSKGLDTLWTADTNGKIYRATAAGGWSQFERCGSIDGIVYDLEVDYFGRLWAGCGYSNSPYGGLYLSTNGGSSWTLRAGGTSLRPLITVAFKNEQFGMAAGWDGTAIWTANAGESWTAIDPQKLASESAHRSATNGPRHYWFISDYGSLWETQDLGVTWSRRFPVWSPVEDIDFYGTSYGLIVGNGIGYYTKDEGQSWDPVSTPVELAEVRMIDSVRAVACGIGGTIWVTENGGASWSRFGNECDAAADVESIEYAGGGWTWLAGRNLVRRLSWSDPFRSCTAYQFADTLWGKNISFRHKGVNSPDTLVLLTAHYDSYSGATPLECAPGADDNGTGVTAVLECARALHDESTERSVEFVLFGGEEEGIIGSRYYASHLDTNVVYKCVLNVDMIGWEPNAAMTALVSGRAGEVADSILFARVQAAIDSFKLDLTVDFAAGTERLTSDHVSFWDAGIPGVLLVEGRRSELTPYYHSCSDIADNLNYEFFDVSTKAALGTVALLAGLLPHEATAGHLALYQNHPNPFSSQTVVSYALPSPTVVELAVYDISGRRVAVIERASRGRGVFERTWDGRDMRGKLLGSGVYFLRLTSGAGEAAEKIVILR